MLSDSKLPPFCYSLKETGQLLGGLCRASIYNAVKRGDLELIKIGGRSVITAHSIHALLNRGKKKKERMPSVAPLYMNFSDVHRLKAAIDQNNQGEPK
ncbi:helix-turn-helix domain-containing protein [Sphingobium chungbukense]|uniref:Helix-turn-helix domain-containing protein n=1 Tax=Sphingobium chungbukense TaxID=56193 RepID=A0A0M3AVR9_9SPHN|nr:helix-turn-helix domain-containing protein [Sphingobium chungbukense]KKW92674.1 hypothetical protein YP76_07000 [Sphingobium chungbukense]